MAAAPAKAAGVAELAVFSPPQPNGKIDSAILAAAKICGIEKVYKAGGAQAIAAMAFGLKGVFEPVDVICGPGNSFVSAAKQIVSSKSSVRIDVPAGPSEVLVIADKTAEAPCVAADMLAQAEHGPDSAAICICTDPAKSKEIAGQLALQLAALPEGSAARISIPRWGRIFIAKSLPQALAASESIAPEHLELMVAEPQSLAGKVKNAGAVFIRTGEVFCDYGMSGGNHILPTNRAARSWGGVSVQTFGKWVYIDELDAAAQARLSKATALLARQEGLEAHARAAEIRKLQKK
jgi:histidinol dehydrogenase